MNKNPRIKLSEDVDKVTMPGRKDAYRLFGADGHALVDLLQQPDEPPVMQGTRVLCRHPFQVYLVVLARLLLRCFWLYFDVWLRLFLPTLLAQKVVQFGPFVHMSISTLSFEPIDLRP